MRVCGIARSIRRMMSVEGGADDGRHDGELAARETCSRWERWVDRLTLHAGGPNNAGGNRLRLGTRGAIACTVGDFNTVPTLPELRQTVPSLPRRKATRGARHRNISGTTLRYGIGARRGGPLGVSWGAWTRAGLAAHLQRRACCSWRPRGRRSALHMVPALWGQAQRTPYGAIGTKVPRQARPSTVLHERHPEGLEGEVPGDGPPAASAPGQPACACAAQRQLMRPPCRRGAPLSRELAAAEPT